MLTTKEWIITIVISLALSAAILGPLIFFLVIPTVSEKNARQTACETQPNVLAIEREVGDVGAKFKGLKWGCLITWPDGRTLLVHYEAYK